MHVIWEDYYETEPERRDIYIIESHDGYYRRQMSKKEIKQAFTPSEFSSVLDGTHPIWIGYKRD